MLVIMSLGIQVAEMPALNALDLVDRRLLLASVSYKQGLANK